MSLSPDSCRRNEKDACYAHSTEVVARQECHLREVSLEIEREGESVGCEEGTEGRGDDGDEGEDAEHDIAFP